MEIATQALHRLTSYAPGRDWDVAPDDIRIVQDLEANDMARLPWFVKRYAERLPRTPLPRELPATTGSAVAVLAGADRVHEFPVAVVALGEAPPALHAGARRRPARWTALRWSSRSSRRPSGPGKATSSVGRGTGAVR